MSEKLDKATLIEKLKKEYEGTEAFPPQKAPEPVTQAFINQWCDAMSDNLPIYRDEDAAGRSVHQGIVAPPTMLQAWVLRGGAPIPEGEGRDRQLDLQDLFHSAGYGSVLGTNCEQEFFRYLKPGDHLTSHMTFDWISEEKVTSVGTGFFVETLTKFTDQNDEPVGEMRFRIFMFIPNEQSQAQAAAATEGADAGPAKVMRVAPKLGHDNQFWWDAAAQGKLLIQRCKSCQTLRHPPRPMCAECQSLDWDTIEASGKGEVYSYVVMHHPKFPPFEYPFTCGVIQLEEGTRFVSNIVGIDPEDVEIGMPVKLSFEEVEDGTTLPLFRPV